MGLWTKGIKRSQSGEHRTEIIGRTIPICNDIMSFINRWIHDKGGVQYKCCFEIKDTHVVWTFTDEQKHSKIIQSKIDVRETTEDNLYQELTVNLFEETCSTLRKLSYRMMYNINIYVEKDYDISYLYKI